MYRSVETSTKHDTMVSKYIAKVAMRMIAHMKPHTLNPSNTISIIGFLKKFELVCDSNSVHKDAAV